MTGSRLKRDPSTKNAPEAGQGFEGMEQNTYEGEPIHMNATAKIAQATDTKHVVTITRRELGDEERDPYMVRECSCGTIFCGSPVNTDNMAREHLTVVANGLDCLYPACTGEDHYADYEVNHHTASREEGENWELKVELFWEDKVWRVYGELKDRQAVGDVPGLLLDDVDEFTAAYRRAHVLAAELNTELAGGDR